MQGMAESCQHMGQEQGQQHQAGQHGQRKADAEQVELRRGAAHHAEGQVDAAFAAAAHTVKERFIQQRLIPMAMEPRAVAAVPQPFGGDMVLYSATQVPHILKVMTALTLGIPEHQMRVIAPSVGGGFGSKLDVYAEELLCVALARKHKVPVRWNEHRSEGAFSTTHGRGQIQYIELAADSDGKVQAMRVRLLADMGGYQQLITAGVPLGTPGTTNMVRIAYVGPLPNDVQLVTLFSLAVTRNAQSAAGAKGLTAFVSAPSATAVLKKHGLEPG